MVKLMDAVSELSTLGLKYNALRNEARNKDDLVTADMLKYKLDAVNECIDIIRDIINKGLEKNNG